MKPVEKNAQVDNLTNASVEDANEKTKNANKEVAWFVRASGQIDYRFIWRINIEQIDGNVEDENYWETNHSWKTELVGTVSQTFLYVHLIIEKRDKWSIRGE